MAQIETPRDAADAQTELKKRARRRLVGAAALALVAAIVLPMVMDHEPRQPVQDVQVRIPSQDGGGFTSRILPAKPTATPLPPAEPVAVVKTEAVLPAKPEPQPEAKTGAKTEAPKAEAKPPEPPKPAAAAKPAEKPAEKVVEKAAEKPAEKPAARKTDETRAVAALAGAAEGGEWVVQLGAYKEAGNVKLLLAKLKDLGVPAYTEKFDSPQGQRTRVRAGPFASREAAEKAQNRIKIIGVQGPVAQK